MPPARLYPLPFAATQPAPDASPPISGEAAATEPDAAMAEAEAYGGLVGRVLDFAMRRRHMPHAALEAIVIGKYFLVDVVDEGAMGIVCTALEPNFGTVALKLPKAAPGPGLRERVLLEGKLLARVHHTNVLRVYEVGECEDTVFIATEYIEGTSLRAWQVDRPWREVLRAYLDVARGLAAIHDSGIVHQDIKPDNVRVDPRGVVRVLDLGLAHLESSLQEHVATAPNGRVSPPHATFYRGGTPGYMAPEQYLIGVTADARADQFAFCAALWEALHGVIPFPSELIAATVDGPSRPALGEPRALTTSGPRWLRRILQRGLSERKADRFPDMHALIAAIERRLNRRWLPALALAAAAATVGALVAVRMTGPDLPMCEDPQHAFAGVWDAPREQTLAATAASARDPSAVPVVDSMRAELTAYTRRWSSAHAAMCQRAHDAGSRVPADEREPCFETRRRAVAQVTAAMQKFAEDHADDPRAPWAEQRARWLRQLDPIDDCLTTHSVFVAADAPRLDPVMDTAITAALAADDAAARVGYQQVLTLAGPDAVADLAWHRARARLGLAELDPSHADVRADLLDALRDAEASGDALLAADVLALFVHVLGDADDPAEALDFVPAALGKLTALGLDTGRRARDLHLNAAFAATQADLLDVAAEHLARVAALRGELAVDPREELAHAQLAHRRGDLPVAVQRARAALDLQLASSGAGTRPVADTLRTLGYFQLLAGDTDAESTMQAALRIYEDRLGAGSPDALTVHLALAKLYYDGDRIDRAREHAGPIARALAGDAGLADLPPAWRPSAELLLGHLAMQDPADPTAAAGHYTRALALLTDGDVPATLASEHWLARLGLTQAELRRGHADLAREALAPVLAAQDGEAAAYRAYAQKLSAELDVMSSARSR